MTDEKQDSKTEDQPQEESAPNIEVKGDLVQNKTVEADEKQDPKPDDDSGE